MDRAFRRPVELVEGTRWLFVVMVVVSGLCTLAAPLATGTGLTKLAAVLSIAVLIGSWSWGYLRRCAPWWLDVVDAVATLVFTLACPAPGLVLGFLVAAIWFRSLYGSVRRALLRCTLYSVALFASVPLWPFVPGHSGGVEVGAAAAGLPSMFLTVIVGQHLVGSMRARQESAQRDAVLMSLGSQLLGVTDAVRIRQIDWAAVAGICAATPGLRVVKVVRAGALLRVDGVAGDFVTVPQTLPMSVVSAPGGHPMLDAAAGTTCAWACVELPALGNDGTQRWALLGARASVLSAATVALATLANQVTLALRSSEVHHELTTLASVDSLTGLANRASFIAAFSLALHDQSRGQVCALFIDLDDFKRVNDQFGHAAGDELLREVAARLGRVTRPQDLCARLGGDEFAIVLMGLDDEAAAAVARRIVATVELPVRVTGGMAHVGASVGMAMATPGLDAEQLLQHADAAMYQAKAGGKARLQVFEAAVRTLQPSGPGADRQPTV